MSEFRRDPLTHRWVIMAPNRGRRPQSRGERPRPKDEDDRCPFCLGHESETPPEIWSIRDERGNWRVRGVPNKFAVLEADGHWDMPIDSEGFVTMPGAGRHEVVIESPQHTADLATASLAAVRDVLQAYRTRYRALEAAGWAYVFIFRNYGPGAGASLAHPHSQIVATPFVPPDVQNRFDIAIDYHKRSGESLYRDVLEWELSDARRIVFEHGRYVVFQPFAASAPFETWIMSRYHRTSFGEASDDELDQFATVLRATLGALRQMAGNPDYNFVIESGPSGHRDQSWASWHFRLVPRLATPAGFELASGIGINSMLPEEAALTLRPVLARLTASFQQDGMRRECCI